MKFSIVTPSYNQSEFIERTIKSVLIQKNFDITLEYFIRDNYSSDGTKIILERYQNSPEIKIHIESDQGQADAINQGWLHSTGDILCWLNSDDIYLPNSLSQIAQVFKENPTIMAVYGEAVYIDDADEVLKSVTNIQDFDHNLLQIHDFITQPSTFIRRQVFDKIGLLSNQYRYIFDWEYWIRISQEYDFVRVPIVVAGYRVTGRNLTTTGGNKRFREMLNLVWETGGVISVIRFLMRLVKKYLFKGIEIPKI